MGRGNGWVYGIFIGEKGKVIGKIKAGSMVKGESTEDSVEG